MVAHACSQTHTRCSNTTQHAAQCLAEHTACYSTCAHTPQTLSTHPRANQPTSTQTQHPTNQPTNKQPTNSKIKRHQTNKAGCNAHHGCVCVCVIHNLGGGGAEHTKTTLTQSVGGHSPRGGGGAREEGWWEAVTCTTPQAHTTGRREGVTHLPDNECPRRSHYSNALSKKTYSCKKETDTLPHLRPNRQVGPSTHTAKCEAGGGG